MTSSVWRKSSRSTQGTSGQCVEVSKLGGMIAIRDSKKPSKGHIGLHAAEFAALIQCIKDDRTTV
jgi:hypothetical protein